MHGRRPVHEHGLRHQRGLLRDELHGLAPLRPDRRLRGRHRRLRQRGLGHDLLEGDLLRERLGHHRHPVQRDGRLRERRELELALAGDAEGRGWPREVERHRCTAARIEKLLADMGRQT